MAAEHKNVTHFSSIARVIKAKYLFEIKFRLNSISPESLSSDVTLDGVAWYKMSW